MKDKREAYLVLPELAKWIEDVITSNGSGNTTQWRVTNIVAKINEREQEYLARERSMREDLELLKDNRDGLIILNIKLEQENTRLKSDIAGWKENFKNMMIERDDYIKKLTATMGKVRDALYGKHLTPVMGIASHASYIDCVDKALALLNEAERE